MCYSYFEHIWYTVFLCWSHQGLTCDKKCGWFEKTSWSVCQGMLARRSASSRVISFNLAWVSWLAVRIRLWFFGDFTLRQCTSFRSHPDQDSVFFSVPERTVPLRRWSLQSVKVLDLLSASGRAGGGHRLSEPSLRVCCLLSDGSGSPAKRPGCRSAPFAREK